MELCRWNECRQLGSAVPVYRTGNLYGPVDTHQCLRYFCFQSAGNGTGSSAIDGQFACTDLRRAIGFSFSSGEQLLRTGGFIFVDLYGRLARNRCLAHTCSRNLRFLRKFHGLASGDQPVRGCLSQHKFNGKCIASCTESNGKLAAVCGRHGPIQRNLCRWCNLPLVRSERFYICCSESADYKRYDSQERNLFCIRNRQWLPGTGANRQPGCQSAACGGCRTKLFHLQECARSHTCWYSFRWNMVGGWRYRKRCFYSFFRR